MHSKLIAALVGAAGYGALVGWAVTADRYERRVNLLEDRVDILAEKLRSQPIVAFMEGAKKGVETTEGEGFDHPTLPFEEVDGPKAPGGDTPETDVTGETEEEDALAAVRGETPEETRNNLQNLINQYSSDPLDAQNYVERGAVIDGVENTPPFVISRDVYSWDPTEEGDDYAKITVTYYPRHRIVLEDDEVMDEPGDVLGWRNLSRFGDESGDADTVFIRNRRLEVDYEVVRDSESDLPLHVKYGMEKDEFEVRKAAGTLKLREEDLE